MTVHKAYDIVGSLPLELLLEVVEYLEPADIVRSQKVGNSLFSMFNGHLEHCCID